VNTHKICNNDLANDCLTKTYIIDSHCKYLLEHGIYYFQELLNFIFTMQLVKHVDNFLSLLDKSIDRRKRGGIAKILQLDK